MQQLLSNHQTGRRGRELSLSLTLTKLNEGQSFQRRLCFHKKYMQHQKGGIECWCSVTEQSRRYTAGCNVHLNEWIRCKREKYFQNVFKESGLKGYKTRHKQLHMHFLIQKTFLLLYLPNCSSAYFTVYMHSLFPVCLIQIPRLILLLARSEDYQKTSHFFGSLNKTR